jgi:hypothetical protein
MILDERVEFADATALSTAGTGAANVGDQVPLSVARNVGSVPRPLYLVIQMVAAAVGASGGVSFALVSDTSQPALVDGTATVHIQTKSIPVASLTAGAVVAVVPLPGEPPAYESNLSIQQNASGSALSAGSINAFLTHDPKQWKAYPDAI